eukprot:CAMPEP_0174695802 /NCGR_PEP_ID=MMETSP1094-20130205/2086_1 /TAXON_ID=156173 /ORGANISM="Chrysochromulina brevifilum, Strain UTEX LB 985" /LENGTH=558 /DNA_ID=CAMNT_0015892383 /DNA_START=87 /DNA_END=1763 /DNA_ORIENTATION=+
MNGSNTRTAAQDDIHYEDTPAYAPLQKAGLLCTEFRRRSIDDIFTGDDLRANSTKKKNMWKRMKYGYYFGVGAPLYKLLHLELFVEASHVGLLMDDKNNYLFAQPGMHNINSMFIKSVGNPVPLTGDGMSGVHIRHGNRTICIVEQGFIGYAIDNGQPVLLPPGIHVWTSESRKFIRQVALNDHKIELGPYTLVTVDEGYAAITQNNGKQCVLPGGHTHLLAHKNWKFEKFITLKIQTDDLAAIEATSADNINMKVNSTVNWRITDVEVAATMAAETMAASGKAGDVAADISKLRRDVLKQALASLAAFIGSVNYSESFHMSAAAQGNRQGQGVAVGQLIAQQATATAEPPTESAFFDNPLYDLSKMGTAVEHANQITKTYGVCILSINIISASPVDQALTKSLASGAVASAQALQLETAARGKANAIRIEAGAEAERMKIAAQGESDAALVRAQGLAEAAKVEAAGQKAAELLRSEGEAGGIRFIAEALQEPGGENAMAQRLGNAYVNQLSSMSQNANLVIVPDRPNDVSSVLTTAMGLSSQISQGFGSKARAHAES